MSDSAALFIGIASLAGVFVGFGALIGVIRSGEIEPPQLGLLRLLVTVSLVVIVASLLPLLLSSYGVDDPTVWTVSSLIFLALVWGVIGLALRSPDYHRTLLGQLRRSRTWAVTFWVARVVIWAAIQIPLVLVVLRISPDRDVAFYLTALTFNLFEAAFILAQIVYAQFAQVDD